jgi:hypothetical protein
MGSVRKDEHGWKEGNAETPREFTLGRALDPTTETAASDRAADVEYRTTQGPETWNP